MRHAPLALALLLALAPSLAAAQTASQAEAEAAERERMAREREFQINRAPLPTLRNAGPCPYVKVLYDAGRYIEFKDNQEAASQVVYSGEIEGVSSTCAYQNLEPISLAFTMLMSFGKGPQATADAKTYRYWVAVTDRNRSVLAKEYFDVVARFPAGGDRVQQSETIRGIVIPRAALNIAGDNFEVLVGFDVTPQMAAFNRDGKRFLPPAAQGPAAAQ